MSKIGRILKTFFWGSTMLAIVVTFSAATFAWFTSNRTVNTNTAYSRTGDERLELELSRTGGGAFRAEPLIDIVQVNTANKEKLMPVSTYDLKNFVYNKTMVDEKAKKFFAVENEEYYYHGRIYLRAAAKGFQEGTRLALYLDQSAEAGGSVVGNKMGNLINASRLGMVFDNDYNNSTIFRFTEEYNTFGESSNTVVDGDVLSDSQVISLDSDRVIKHSDPSKLLKDYTIQFVDNEVKLPTTPLLYMEIGKIYQLDIYFYVEGCDPDSVLVDYNNGLDFHLGFYGLLYEEGN